MVDFGGLAVFADAKDTYVCIPLLSKTPQPPRIDIARVRSLAPTLVEGQMSAASYTVPETRFSSRAWSLASDTEIALFDKLVAAGKPLGSVIGPDNFFRGVTTGLNNAFVISAETRDMLIANDANSADLIHPVRGGEDVREYSINPADSFLIFTRRGTNIDAYPAIKTYLEQFKAELTPKRKPSDKTGRKPGNYRWYEIQDDVAYFEIFERPKIIFPDICKHPRFCYDDTGLYLTNTAYALGTGDKYLLGLLNSRVFWFCIRHISIPFGVRAGQYRYRLIAQYMGQVPIRVANLEDPENKLRYAKIVDCVNKMLAAKKSAAATANMPNRQIAALDRQIDSLVYELYGLTDDEIVLVQGKS